MKVKCLIVDDEPLAIEIIENYLTQIEGFEVLATCKNALKAFKVLEEEKIDLMFLDIQMPQLTGIDFLKSLKNTPRVIFTTAHIDYAIESYELDILDYLVKPVSFPRFLKAIDKYRSLEINRIPRAIPPIESKEFVYVKSNKKNYKIYFNEMLYVESLKDYVKIVAKTRELAVKTTLSEFEENLPKDRFLRVHRSFIVNQDHVTAHTRKDVEIGEIEIPIGGSYKQKVFDTLT